MLSVSKSVSLCEPALCGGFTFPMPRLMSGRIWHFVAISSQISGLVAFGYCEKKKEGVREREKLSKTLYWSISLTVGLCFLQLGCVKPGGSPFSRGGRMYRSYRLSLYLLSLSSFSSLRIRAFFLSSGLSFYHPLSFLLFFSSSLFYFIFRVIVWVRVFYIVLSMRVFFVFI